MTRLTFSRYRDDLVETHGHHVTSDYVSDYWLPTVGPTSLWLLRWVERHTSTGSVEVDAQTLARSLGLGHQTCRVLSATLHRLCIFKLAADDGGGAFRCRTHLSPLTQNQKAHLPAVLQLAHDSTSTGRAA